MYESYYDFLKYSLSETSVEPDTVARIDWNKLLDFGRKHSIVGVLFHGMNRLSAVGENRPDNYAAASWLVNSEIIVKTNKQVNRDAAILTDFFHRKANVKACVLKGQGNALMYPDPYMRTPGDIDLWTEMDTVPLLKFIKSLNLEPNIEYHHVDFSFYTKTVAEIHYFPSFMGNLFYEWRLRKYFNQVKKEQFINKVELPDNAGSIFVPTDSFNRIFQMSHIMHHFFFEGIGLRQIIDYYYLLKRGFSQEEQQEEQRLLRRFNMFRFSAGIMWILYAVLGLQEEYLLLPPDEDLGKMILSEIEHSGNFGHHDERYSFKGSSVFKQYLIETYRNLHFAMEFPSETIWGRPVSRWWHMIYKAYLRFKTR